MKYIMPLIILAAIACAQPAFAQENDSLARRSFAMAESAYANAQYKEVIDYLKYAEIYSGGANSRSLFLKIRALDQLTNQDASNLPALQSAMDRFFAVTDKSIYPQEKYQEITSISNRRKGISSGPTVIPASNNKNAEELADYQKAIKINTLEGYKEFIDKYSYTPHYGEIKKRYDEMVEDSDEYRNHRIKH